ncbi:hypothetical protein M405DRAFT_694118, partial [Rhizopogon salebrosus TDB-379]
PPPPPQDAARETKLSLPKMWHAESVGTLCCSAYFLCATKYLAWPVALLALSSVMNQHPLRTKEGGSTLWATLM